MVAQTEGGDPGNAKKLPRRGQVSLQISETHTNSTHKKKPIFPSAPNLRRERNTAFPLLPCSTIEAEFGLFSCARKLILADKWTDVSCRMKAEDGIPALETALSLTTSAEEYLTVLLYNVHPSALQTLFAAVCAEVAIPSSLRPAGRPQQNRQ